MSEVVLLELDDITPSQTKDEEVIPPNPPYFLLDNVSFDEELDYILTESGLPVYYFDGKKYRDLGTMVPTTDQVIRAKFMGIFVKLFRSNGDILDFSQVEHYIPLIVL